MPMKRFLTMAQEDEVARTVNTMLKMTWQERGWTSAVPKITGPIVRYTLAAVEDILPIGEQQPDLQDQNKALRQACEAVLSWAVTDITEEQGTLAYFAEEVVPLVEEALALGGGDA